LTLRVKNEFFENKRIPGAKKIAAKLSSVEDPVNTKAVAKIMRENNWKSKTVKKYKATTNSKHDLPVAENILNRDFNSDAPNKKWVSDITCIATDEGWLYLAGILDLCGREVAGWSM
jgi:transposase InsO family protein